MRHYFLGSNTPLGFAGYYNQANKDGNRLFILKGGSGVGKHTFMKKIAQDMEARGFEVDYCHCSNDVDSLDGVIIPEIGVGLIDGTAPHMVDPQLPGCFDEIVDLGRYIDNEQVVPYRSKIAELSAKKKARYNRAYTYLACAKQLYEDSSKLITDCTKKGRLRTATASLPKSLLGRSKGRQGQVFHIFASAYTSGGYVDYISTLTGGKATIGIKNYHCLNTALMEAIYDSGLAQGVEMTVCHSIVNPHKIDHVLLPDLCILSIDEQNKFSEVDEVISLKDMVDKDKILDAQSDITWNNAHYDELVRRGIDVMASCGQLHKELEAIYIPAMDFSGVDRELEKVSKKIRSFIE